MKKQTKILVKLFPCVITVLLVFFALHYMRTARYYGEFSLSIFDREGINITQEFEFYGLSYFGDTIELYPQKLEYKNKSQVYLKSLMVNSFYSLDSIEVRLQDDSLTSVNQGFKKGNNVIKLACNESIRDKIISIKIFRYLFVLILVLFLISLLFVIFDKEVFKLLNKKIIKFFFLLILVLIIVVAIVLLVRKFHTNPSEVTYYPDFNYETNFNYTLTNCNSELQIEIRDTSGSGLEFIFNLNDKFWFNENDFKRSLLNLNIDSTYGTPADILKAFKLVSNYTYHKCPHEKIQRAKVLNNPYLLLNSIGSGLCNNRAVALSFLTNSLGYRARLLSVDGHAFSEVFNNDKWILLDPDYGLSLITSEQEIASISEIRNESDLRPKVVSNCFFINNFENSFNPYPIRLENLYKRETLTSSFYNEKLSNQNSYFELPKGSTVTFPLFCDSIDSYLMKVNISGNYFGKVRIPLLIHSIRGNSLYDYYYLDTNMFLYDEFFVSGTNIEILAFINPLLFIPDIDQKFEFTYLSSRKTKPKIKFSEKSDTLNYFTSIPQIMQLFNEVKLYYYEIACEYLIDKNNEILVWNDFDKLICAYVPEFENDTILRMQVKNLFVKVKEQNEDFQDIINDPGIVAVLIFLSEHNYSYNYSLILFNYIGNLSEYKPI